MSETNELSPRIAIQVRLALTEDSARDKALTLLLAEAKRAGLTNAEIDAARSGRSFEARACAAIRLARAIASSGSRDLQQARDHAAEFGLCPNEIAQIEQLVVRLATRRTEGP